MIFVLSDAAGKGSTATSIGSVTDDLGGTWVSQASHSLTGGLQQGLFEAEQILYTPDGMATSQSLICADGSRRVNVMQAGSPSRWITATRGGTTACL